MTSLSSNSYDSLIHSVPQDSLGTLAFMIVISLGHFDCNNEGIARVLRSYRLDHLTKPVLEHIKNNATMKALDQQDRIDSGRRVYNIELDGLDPHTYEIDTTLTIDYQNGLPVKMIIECPRLPDLPNPHETIVVQAANGQHIITRATGRQVVCCIWDRSEN